MPPDIYRDLKTKTGYPQVNFPILRQTVKIRENFKMSHAMLNIFGTCLIVALMFPTPAQAFLIKFDSDGIFRHDFSPPDGAGAIEYRVGAEKKTDIHIINPGQTPVTRRGTNLNGDIKSPIETKDGNPGQARVLTDLSVGHGDGLGNLESDGSKPPPQGFEAPIGAIVQSFSASGFWRVVAEPGDKTLTQVALDGILKGDVRLDKPFFGSASAFLSGTVRVDPFGSFDFQTGEKVSGGDFGIGVDQTGGSINFSIPENFFTVDLITFTDISKDILLDTPYAFSLTGSLSASLSSFGITGSAFSVANLWAQEFNLTPSGIPEPGTLPLLAISLVGFLSSAGMPRVWGAGITQKIVKLSAAADRHPLALQSSAERRRSLALIEGPQRIESRRPSL